MIEIELRCHLFYFLLGTCRSDRRWCSSSSSSSSSCCLHIDPLDYGWRVLSTVGCPTACLTNMDHPVRSCLRVFSICLPSETVRVHAIDCRMTQNDKCTGFSSVSVVFIFFFSGMFMGRQRWRSCGTSSDGKHNNNKNTRVYCILYTLVRYKPRRAVAYRFAGSHGYYCCSYYSDWSAEVRRAKRANPPPHPQGPPDGGGALEAPPQDPPEVPPEDLLKAMPEASNLILGFICSHRNDRLYRYWLSNHWLG